MIETEAGEGCRSPCLQVVLVLTAVVAAGQVPRRHGMGDQRANEITNGEDRLFVRPGC